MALKPEPRFIWQLCRRFSCNQASMVSGCRLTPTYAKRALPYTDAAYSHSIVAGGLPEMS